MCFLTKSKTYLSVTTLSSREGHIQSFFIIIYKILLGFEITVVTTVLGSISEIVGAADRIAVVRESLPHKNSRK